MVQNVVFVLMMIIAVGAGVVTAVYEVARPGKDKKTESSQAAEKKE